ncbi:MAG: nuclear transport factor 2 family protein [Gammaproteobacteria bacterium]|nr:nuclear transport factor 2 family protein [Gammaproteobacteria bacterium]
MSDLYRILLALTVVFVVACSPDRGDATRPVVQDTRVSNVPLAQAGYAAFAVGDMDTVIGMMAPDLVWHEAESLPYGGTYHGPDAVMENIFMALAGDWDDYEAEPRQFIDGGEHVVVTGEYRGVHRRHGGRLQSPFVHIWRFVDGQLVEFHQHTDTALWLQAAAEGAID